MDIIKSLVLGTLEALTADIKVENPLRGLLKDSKVWRLAGDVIGQLTGLLSEFEVCIYTESLFLSLEIGVTPHIFTSFLKYGQTQHE